ncbi:methyltransferase domain-containing protein [Terracoccus luteus]|uniref:Trans-aconitate 2-methyltransferase n=1 Tax=Terracoccus luteus TaxID=53356 RepID=A0A495Y179_9MICO|nr:methyltransferase domain-containing protein [Terracoccus luteus]MBB2985757.1 trans-aconitate 2-methyltransferase [Terracoccus luteus]MCP2171409.1 trans-aconitate 2-methyltransferase [Terracoccus luteus]RKT78513.1 trans-aconitate 2-methyltransferase [Terracoccus luteus]
MDADQTAGARPLTAPTASAWDPAQYAHFGDHRSRPFHELVARAARVATTEPRLVVDLGCGPGELTLTLADRWPGARVVGVDSSPEMLDRAREQDRDGRVEWVHSGAEAWDPAGHGAPVDLLVSNATLQWVPTHLRLLPGWVRALAPDGTLAMQVPSNFDAPSHALMRAVAARHPRAADLAPGLDRASGTAQPETYASLLLALTPHVDVWQTTYLQVLDTPEDGTHPVLDWVRGTGLRPVLGVLTDPAEREAFLADYAAELEQAYPRRDFGVIFPFSRTFAVARRAGS